MRSLDLFNTLFLALVISPMCKELEIQQRSPHKFRKTFISQLINGGADVDFVREQAGHQQISTTYNAYVFSTSRDDAKIKLLIELC